MGSYPWGPHGPQTGPNEVTPNPTPSYVPPPPMQTYVPPSPRPVYSAGGGSASYSSASYPVARGSSRPSRKRYWLALSLTFLFGPLGLFYASKKGALVMLFLLFAVPIGLSMAGMLPWGSQSHPFAILNHDSVMDQMWSLAAFFSMIWAVIGVRIHNASL